MAIITKETDKGIAFRINNVIYLHKNLKNYPILRNALLKHELKHTDFYTVQDLKIDLFGSELKEVKRDYYKFLLKEKGASKQLLPFLSIEGQVHLDLTLTILYFSAIVLFLIIWSLI